MANIGGLNPKIFIPPEAFNPLLPRYSDEFGIPREDRLKTGSFDAS
jgi:hypothetical protein